MKKEDYYKILRSVIFSEITEIINYRNKTENNISLKFEQIFNFIYKDGQVMLTVGGILYDENDRSKFEKMALQELRYYKNSEDYFNIRVPLLTNREIQAIDKYLPDFNTHNEAKQKAIETLNGIVSTESIEDYSLIYRYFPLFTEINFL